MPPPRPHQVAALLDELDRLLPRLEDSYRWAWPAAYSRHVRESNGQSIRSTGYSDPTGLVAMDRAGDGVRDDGTEASLTRHEKMRRALYRSSAAVDRAVGVLRGALGELERAMGEREDDWSGARVPRMITAADPEAAKAAQGRRLARGEGWGEG